MAAPPRWSRLRAAWPDLALLAFAALQLWPFLSAFHQSADDNFWQLAVLTTLDRPASLIEEVRKAAQEQGRIGIYPALILVMLGAMLQEYAWGRVLIVALFGFLILAFCHLLALRFRLPLTRPALLATLCITPMVAHHLPPNAYPLMLTLPLLGLVALHVHLARKDLPRAGGMAAALGLAALMLVLEYALIAGSALAALAVLTSPPGQRRHALLLHGTALLASATVYLGYRLAFPSDYSGNMLQAIDLSEVFRLQLRHMVSGTVFPYLPRAAAGRMDLALAFLLLLGGARAAARLLPPLARDLRPRLALGLLLCCGGWIWLNTLFHALTPKYQSWCRMGDCAYVDSRLAGLGVGVAAAVGLAGLLHLLRARGATLLCAGLVGLVASLTFLHNRASAREMAGRERAFGVLRSAACHPEAGIGRDEAVLQTLARTVWWHQPPARVPPAEAYLAAYAERLDRLGLSCRPIPFAPRPWPVEFLGWSVPEPTGRWSIGRAGLILLTGREGSGGMVLSLSAHVPSGGAEQRVRVRTDTAAGCGFRLGAPPREVFVPLEPGRQTILVIETPDAVSPSTLRESEDPRRLGVFLFGIRGLRDGEAAPDGIDLRRCPAEGE
ncbi:hypothetical protein [Muricoccus pecuniae]|uniref:Glycosyltransferase RgtA/B/C/D-like domain-containing protein n=1 Tax=Muricoccus pecuniae TaxID=693023 RepID=A0A840XV36_9PROT|nr:hypothetical protein [Roseomonas pecuniae]MBB5692598.1 hypothetical protein [Roseomonas pecuniae]